MVNLLDSRQPAIPAARARAVVQPSAVEACLPAARVTRPNAHGLFLTTYDKAGHATWCSRTVVLPGWLEEVRETWRKPWRRSFFRDLRWGWKLLKASKTHPAVITGSERSAHIFALLQKFTRRSLVPHICIEWWCDPAPGRIRTLLRRLQYRLELGAISRVVVFATLQVQEYSRLFRVPHDRFVFLPFHATLYNTSYQTRDGNYIFAGGDTNRDYVTLLKAVSDLPYRVVIAAFEKDHFRGVVIPPNVEIVSGSASYFFGLMAAAGVVVVPMRGSAIQFGGFQTWVNAMTMGKATVVADTCAADYIVHGLNGMIVAPGDASALRRTLQELMTSPGLRRQLGDNARATAAAFAPERFFERVFALADECVQNIVTGRDTGREERPMRTA